MLIVKSYSVSKINCFTYVLFVAASALYNVFVFASHIVINFESFILKETDDPSVKCLQRSHLGSLHFLTLNSSGCLLVNFAFVSTRFKFGG